ncbi:TlpA disulfide reductase family protein [uncultured Roseovarius sp.]|uniref:TlpA family protein disulfide reductase n=1 Tax=uncultured Roseovarius sp. TaxID=293344 RepID=UPI00260B67C6|nr:TlpA disulfide reductase family protein [uncultured Roseovarius sp.]
MRQILLAMLMLIGSAETAMAQGEPLIPLHEKPRALPDISFADSEGATVSLRNWKGKLVLLNIWATWCVPCREEMPTLDKVQKELGSDSFEVVALSIDRAGIKVVEEFYREINIRNLRVFVDDSGAAARDLKVFGLPATLLIDTKGQELGRLIGAAEWDSPEMISFIKSTISQQMKGDQK